jgi:hypothetical protein
MPRLLISVAVLVRQATAAETTQPSTALLLSNPHGYLVMNHEALARCVPSSSVDDSYTVDDTSFLESIGCRVKLLVLVVNQRPEVDVYNAPGDTPLEKLSLAMQGGIEGAVCNPDTLERFSFSEIARVIEGPLQGLESDTFAFMSFLAVVKVQIAAIFVN